MKGHKIDFQCGKKAEQQFLDTLTGNITHETPKKRKQKEKEQDIVSSENVCRVCVLFGNHWKTRKVTRFG